jgi:RsiW-degrading membrane proteinase PrsW (M82 family)
VVAVALIYRLFVRRELMPRDYLFLGAVSGLVFRASEVVDYFTVNGLQEFYLTVQSARPSIQQLIVTGHSAPDSVFAVLIGPVRYFVLDFVWRFLTDPITHACWAGLTGYFIGLAASGRHNWYTVELDRPGRRRDPARAERLEPSQRPSAVDPDDPGQRHPVPRLRQGRVPR